VTIAGPAAGSLLRGQIEVECRPVDFWSRSRLPSRRTWRAAKAMRRGKAGG